MTKRHREAINIETKYQILKLVEKGEKYSNIMKEFNLKNKANISVILKQKEEIMKAFKERNLCNRKSLKTTNYEDIEEHLLKFIALCNNNKLPVNGSMLKEKAKNIAFTIGYENFESSNGWFYRFCRRNAIFFKVMHGESGSVSDDSKSEWLHKILPSILGEFQMHEIYNADEFGLFFRLK